MSRQFGFVSALALLLFISACESYCDTADALESCHHPLADVAVLEQRENDDSAAALLGLLQRDRTTSAKVIGTMNKNSTACLAEILPLLTEPNDECHHQCGDIYRDPNQVATYKDLVSHPSVRTICETGFYEGRSSAMWLCTNPNAKLYSFDLEFPHANKQAIQQYFGDRFVPIEGDSMETLKTFASDPSSPYCDLMIADGGHYDPVPWSDLNNFASIASKDLERSHHLVVDEVYFSRKNGCCMNVTRAHERALHEGMYDTGTGFCQIAMECYIKVPGDLDQDGVPRCDGTEKSQRFPLVGTPDQTLNSTYPNGGFCVMSFDREFLTSLNRSRE